MENVTVYVVVVVVVIIITKMQPFLTGSSGALYKRQLARPRNSLICQSKCTRQELLT